ncbi:hypothetical protein CXG81DRAFT_25337 [Caulochytrium protostelioides]|uniref:ATP synthase subunit 4 n=1 Tax=Caulochytrium protostelioides TaxID=1555241 RepID=A0A4P9X9L2_9FUNG|nr:hypothetical protein CXG81DRAFT_25337 [Caulochytrium protostelioides]|eukprot:RKP01986.1 hypothetical protein CXG81DRAFT_25337 [Caulochytrium protostelioides]
MAPAMTGLARRFASTTPAARPDPAEKAQSLISMMPGQNLAAQSTSVLVATSLAAYALSKEVYLIDMETFEMASIAGAWYLWYSGVKEPAREWFAEKRATMRRVLEEARADHKAVVQERIAHFDKMSDLATVTADMYGMAREIAHLEAEAYALQQRVAYQTEIRATLDQWVRHEANVRNAEQKDLVDGVIAKVQAGLKDNKVQQAILTQALADVDAALAKAK